MWTCNLFYLFICIVSRGEKRKFIWSYCVFLFFFKMTLAADKWLLSNNSVFCSTLGSDSLSLPSFASSQNSWGTLRQSLKSLSVEFAVLSDKAAQQVQSWLLHLLFCALLVQFWHRVIHYFLPMSPGRTRRGWCCWKAESFSGFVAVLQSKFIRPERCLFTSVIWSCGYWLSSTLQNKWRIKKRKKIQTF